MSTPPTNRIAAELSLNEKLHVLLMCDSRIINQNLANQSNTAPQTISEIFQSRHTSKIESFSY